MTNTTTAQQHKLVAQLAVEAVINDPMAYDHDTVETVKAVARSAGVAKFYLDQLEEL